MAISNITRSTVNLPELPQQQPYLYKRQSAATNFIEETLIRGTALPEPAKKLSFAIVEEKNGQQKLQLFYENSNTEFSLEIPDLSKIAGNNKTARAFMTFALVKINQQCISQDNELYNDCITFKVNDLVRSADNPFGMYTDRSNARRGFVAGADVLTSLKIKGTAKGKKNNSFCAGLEVLFTGAEIKDNECKLYLNDRINWPAMLPYITMLPPYTMKLLISNSKAGELVEYIFYMARQKQNAEQIKKTGCFKIPYKSIVERLNLPMDTKNPKRNVKDVIEKAIEAIETENSNAYHNDDFTITPSNGDVSDILPFKEWLEGYITIEFKNEPRAFFADRATARHKQIDKKRKAKDKAIAQNAAKSKPQIDNSTATDSGQQTILAIDPQQVL